MDCRRVPLQMLFAFFGIHDVGSLFAPVEAIFEEGAKHPVLLIAAIKESANVTLPAEIASGELYGMIDSHISPHTDSRDTNEDLIWIYRHLVRRACALAKRPSLLYLDKELVRWNEERVLL